MYDLIHIRVPNDLLDQYQINDDQIRKVLEVLNEQPNTRSLRFTGYIKNLSVWRSNEGLSIRGSWPKFILGNNLSSVNLREVKAVITILSNLLGIPIENAYVSQLEFGFNLPVKNPVWEYLAILESAAGYHRETNYKDSTNTFIQSERRISFYDKIKEVKRKTELPSNFTNENILRYEIKLSYPSRLLSLQGGMKVSDLTSMSIANSLIGIWLREYFSVVKNLEVIETPKIASLRDFTSFVMLKGSEDLGGKAGLLDLLKSLKYAGHLSSKTRHDIKRKITSLYKGNKMLTSNPLAEELDQIVLTIATFSILPPP